MLRNLHEKCHQDQRYILNFRSQMGPITKVNQEKDNAIFYAFRFTNMKLYSTFNFSLKKKNQNFVAKKMKQKIKNVV